MSSSRWKEVRIRILIACLFVPICLLFLFPIYTLFLAALRPGRDLMRFGITIKTIIPTGLAFSHLASLLMTHDGIYMVWMRNSLILTGLYTGLSLFLSSLVGYGLGVYSFKGKKVLLSLVIFIMMVPLQILILPLYKLMIGLRSMNTFHGIILPFVVSPFAVFFFRQYVIGIPRDFMDAGRIDGLSEMGIYFRVMAPLMAPAFGAIAILGAQQSWNNFLWPLIVLRTGKMFNLPIGLTSLLSPYGSNYDLLISGSLAATVPLIIVFFFFQRYFIAGLAAGGIKA